MLLNMFNIEISTMSALSILIWQQGCPSQKPDEWLQHVLAYKKIVLSKYNINCVQLFTSLED